MTGKPTISAQPSDQAPDPRRWIALALLATAQFMVILDASIVNIALPSIERALHFSKENLSWVVNAYVLPFGGLLLLGGRAADLLGRRRVFVAALWVFAAASLAGGFAQSEAQLLIARVVQGAAAAALAPAALSLVTATFTNGAERTRALSIWGAVAGSGAAVGVLLGGVLTSGPGWRWVLFVNVPVGVAAALLAPRLVRESRAQTGRRRFDVAGAVTVSAGLSVLVYALIQAQDHGWGSVRTIALLGAAAALLAAFTIIERRAADPLMPFAIFRLRTVRAANAVALLVGGALISMFFFLSLYLQQVLGYSAIEAGLAQLPLAATIILAAGLASPLIGRFGVRAVMVTGLALFVVGLLWLTGAGADGSFAGDLLGPSLVIAVALGLAFVPMTVASVDGVGESAYGLASGLINTTQQIGGALGLAIASTVANARTDDLMRTAHGDPAALPGALTGGFHAGFLVDAGLAALAIVAATVLLRRPKSRTATSALPAGQRSLS